MAFKGDLLKTWRISHGLTQAEAGSRINVSQNFWRNLESGMKQPSIDTLVLISKETGISVDDLLGNPTQPLPTQEPEQGEREAV